MWTRLFPWRYVISRLAKRQGFIDPIALLSRLHRFAQPSEVTEPIELLRAGVVFHARGLLNARSIQHNLDWVWPYWVERQFDPLDPAFVPRAFSITHVNLTHRNWTAVGVPDCDWYPIVDPRGLVTPLFDGWSIDAWIIPDEGEPHLPSRSNEADQELLLADSLQVVTRTENGTARLEQATDMVWDEDGPNCRLRLATRSENPGWLAVAIRPVNPEGVSLIHDIASRDAGRTLTVEDEAAIHFDRAPDRLCMSHYREGDVLRHLAKDWEARAMHCEVGMATAAAMFRLDTEGTTRVEARIPLAEASHREEKPARKAMLPDQPPADWSTLIEGTCRADLPDDWMQFLFDAAVRNLVLHSPRDVYPGPYTYKRFWFRDAAFILHALLVLGLPDRARRCIEHFPERQNARGYFHSQEGEWDSNGEAIWIMDRYRRLTGESFDPEWLRAVVKGTRWIENKRMDDDLEHAHAGLMPAGFSAEHLGPNDYYFWDDFWSLAGLQSGADILDEAGRTDAAAEARQAASRLESAIERAIRLSRRRNPRPGIAASPYRGMDSGAIGSVAVGYPLQLWEPEDQRLLDTADFLLDNCMVKGGFFQDMIHSGMNAYLTLHIAQVLLRAGDPRHFELMESVAAMASPTGQWPEAIHPQTAGGCMGDGQHIWAAAEWVLMVRNCFVREEGKTLVVGEGLPEKWLTAEGTPVRLGPTPTPHGPVTVTVRPHAKHLEVECHGEWRDAAPRRHVRLAGCDPVCMEPDQESIIVPRSPAAGTQS